MATRKKRSRAGSGAAKSKSARGSGRSAAGRGGSTRSASARGGASRTGARRSGGRSASGRGRSLDAIKLLKQDHREVEQLVDKFERSRSGKQEIAQQICHLLTVHAQIEEEIFYPAAREALRDEDLVDEAEVEHASAKDLIAQIEGMDEDEDKFEAKVKVLGEYVRHHVKEEETELFKQLSSSRKLDLEELGQRLLQRKQELMGEMGMAEGMDDEDLPRARGNGAGRHAGAGAQAQGRGFREM